MVAEKTTPKKNKTLENDVSKEAEKPVVEQEKEAEIKGKPEVEAPVVEEKKDVVKKKKPFKRLFFTGIFAILVITATVPQIREQVVQDVKNLLKLEKIEEEDLASQENIEELIEEEQKENKEDFENADVIVAVSEEAPVASVKVVEAVLSAEVAPVETQPDFSLIMEEIALLKNQNASLQKEIGGLKMALITVRNNQKQAIEEISSALPSAEMIEKRFVALAVREKILKAEIEANHQQIERVEENKAEAGIVLSLLTRMELAETKLADSDQEKEKNIDLLLALYQLRESLLAGRPFDVELETAVILSSSKQEVRSVLFALKPFARKGVFVKSDLINSFDSYANKAALSEGLSVKTDWFHQAVNSLKKLIVIRKMDASSEEISTQNVLAHAQQAVEDGDLALAISDLRQLKGPAYNEMLPWIKKTGASLRAVKNVNEAISLVLRYVARQEG